MKVSMWVERVAGKIAATQFKEIVFRNSLGLCCSRTRSRASGVISLECVEETAPQPVADHIVSRKPLSTPEGQIGLVRLVDSYDFLKEPSRTDSLLLLPRK